MIDGGILLMVLGSLGMIVAPLDAALAHRRWLREIPDRVPVRQAFRLPAPDAALTALIEHLDR